MKKVLTMALAIAAGGWARAEPMRPLYVKENKFPGAGKLEAGALARYAEYDREDQTISAGGQSIVFSRMGHRDEVILAPYLRYGLLDHLAVEASLPYVDIDRQYGDDSSGMGDAKLGFQLRAYQDIFDYPYVIPHLETRFATGDENEGLGRGYGSVSLGCSVGTVVADVLHWIADARYELREGHERENVAVGALAIIWDVSKQLSVIAEGYLSDEDLPGGDHPAYGQGGLCYKATPRLAVNIYGGAGKNTGEDMIGHLKVSYSF